METIAQRIMKLVDALGGNKSDFARRIKVTPAYISKLGKQPDSIPSDRTISDICREFNVSELWLRTGEGEMFQQMSRSEEISAFIGDVLSGEPDFRRRLILGLARLNQEEWAMLERVAKKLLEEETEQEKADP